MKINKYKFELLGCTAVVILGLESGGDTERDTDTRTFRTKLIKKHAHTLLLQL